MSPIKQLKKIDSAGPDSSPLQFTQSDVAKSIKSFRAGTAPGPSGLRPEHIKTAVFAASNSRADKCLSTITKLVNILCGSILLWWAASSHKQEVWWNSTNYYW